jgi:hypothetical protein
VSCEHNLHGWMGPDGPVVACELCGVRFEYVVREPTRGQRWLQVEITTADGSPPTEELIATSDEVAHWLVHERKLEDRLG